MTTLYWFYLVPILARIIACIGIVISFFVPSESKLYVIYGMGNTIDYIRTNDKAKQLPDKAIDCIYINI